MDPSNVFTVKSGAFERVNWTVLSIVGEEAVSELFSFTVHLLAKRADIELALPAGGAGPVELALVGQSVELRVDERGMVRYGIVASARVEAAVELGGEPCSRVRVEVVPRAWLLTQRRNSRIFQHLYLHQIVSRVLSESGIKHEWSLVNIYRKRVYCTQYDETDYEFVTRLLAEEGILFYFAHRASFAGGETPEYLHEPTPLETASQVAGAIGKAASGIGALAGSEKLEILGGRGAYVVSDMLAPKPKDEESDDPLIFPPGLAGPGGAGDVFVFLDNAGFYAPIATSEDDPARLALTLRDEGGLDGDHRILTALEPVHRIRAKGVDLRDYDFRRPMLLLEASADATAESRGYAPEKSWAVDGDAPLDVYAHHGEYETPELDPQLAGLVLEQHRADALVMAGRGHCPLLFPGGSFQLENATATHLQEGPHAVVRVRHEWHAPSHSRTRGGEIEPVIDACATAIHEAILSREPLAEETIRQLIRREMDGRPRAQRTYQNRFECVPASIAYRPPRPRRVARNVTESATVVGPIGIPETSFTPRDPTAPAEQLTANEIYTDRFGRVKIQFHWDREGKFKENSSCWVRVVQTWSGAGFGFQFIPRVGMEVLVTFLAGDPDRPVIIGSLYNATHATPEPLPQRGTRSGIRTQSSPGGGGFNELSFEDAKGAERIYVHAQKDLDVLVNDTHTQSVKNNQKVMVTRAQEVSVGGNQIVGVGQSRSIVVGRDLSESVAGNRTSTVDRNESDFVRGNSLRSVDGVSARSVKADDLTVVEGDQSLTVRGDSITQVGGRSAGQKSNAVTFVDGSSFLTVTERVLVKAETVAGDGSKSAIRLECGDSFIELRGDKITISAKTIEILGGDSAKMKGKEAEVKLDQEGATVHGDPITLQTPKGSKLLLDGPHSMMVAPQNAGVHGGKIALKTMPTDVLAEIAKLVESQKTPDLTLVFSHGKPVKGEARIANTRYRVVVDDLVYEGKTLMDGLLPVWVPDTARVALVTLWANEIWPELYPAGPLIWVVHIVKDMAAADTLRGARIRLRNLAYDPSAALDAPAPPNATADDLTQGALLEFQLDQALPATGALDEETKKKLAQAYGGS